MRLYAPILKIARFDGDDGSVLRIEGIASTETRDLVGEIVRADAIRKAIAGYMAFPALREMHGLSAAGKTTSIEVRDDNITRITAEVVDSSAILKLEKGIYSGLSIGGKVKARDQKDKTVVTEIVLNEISLVDRPANSDCSLSLLKAGGVESLDELPDAALVEEALARMSSPARAELIMRSMIRLGAGQKHW